MRRRFVRAHAAARIIIGARLGRPPRAVRFTRGRWGKPSVEDAGGTHFSLSHSGELALLALAPRPVGVDVELARAGLDADRLARRFFPQPERELVERDGLGAFVRLWTRKEACVKAAGARLTQGMGVPVAHTAPQAVVHDPTGALQGPWRVADLALPAGYAGAVALLGGGPFSVSSRMWYDMPPEESDAMSAIRGVK
ncbi:4'-phosphopantetheinyl transferase superfamily protein [Streptomyces sp. NPDC045251]|uniref:4'-phosphopantetheinyl transferase family protein n=1 Tax=unclassified Streptomyces TaxID=2593676 RepID=UPI0033E83159